MATPEDRKGHRPKRSAPQPSQYVSNLADRPRTPNSKPHVGASQARDAEYQRFVLTDHIAFRYLEQDPTTKVLERRQELQGYECYIVEQWSTSRTHPTFAITTHTGDPSHIVVVGVLSVPTDESKWSPRLRVYFKALNQYHATRRQTPLGIIMVTNLTGLPSTLTVIHVPDGDLLKHRSEYFVNENLKRLGCSGRSGLALTSPAPATTAKFVQLYRTSEKVEVTQAVIALVKLCQTALMLFAKLDIDYADGLLCDMTERAIGDWWLDIGTVFYNVEPHDGILGPTSVAGLLGLLMGARNRLHAIGAPVAKDPFDVESMKRGIGAFQKQQRLPRTRRLDRQTLIKLHQATHKAADKERWLVPRAVKSTVAELSGKSGEMVMDAVGRRDRAGIAEVETVDIDHFVPLVSGERSKWLWLGKSIKKSKSGMMDEHLADELVGSSELQNGLVFQPDDHGGFSWAPGKKSTFNELNKAGEEKQDAQMQHGVPPDVDGGYDSSDNGLKASVYKRANALKDEAKHGIGKVKGAVSIRGHRPKPSVDDPAAVSPPSRTASARMPRTIAEDGSTSVISGMSPGSGSTDPQSNHRYVQGLATELHAAVNRERDSKSDARLAEEVSVLPSTALPRFTFPENRHDHSQESFDMRPLPSDSREASVSVLGETSVAGSVNEGSDPLEVPTVRREHHEARNPLLRRTVSSDQTWAVQRDHVTSEGVPRHLSFSLAEDSLLGWSPVTANNPYNDGHSNRPLTKWSDAEFVAAQARRLQFMITALDGNVVSWTQDRLAMLDRLIEQADEDRGAIDTIHMSLEEAVQSSRGQSDGTVQQEKEALEGGVKEIEMLGARLEYEINELRSKIEDVEAGVVDFEKGVSRVEQRVGELEKETSQDSAWQCIVA